MSNPNRRSTRNNPVGQLWGADRLPPVRSAKKPKRPGSGAPPRLPRPLPLQRLQLGPSSQVQPPFPTPSSTFSSPASSSSSVPSSNSESSESNRSGAGVGIDNDDGFGFDDSGFEEETVPFDPSTSETWTPPRSAWNNPPTLLALLESRVNFSLDRYVTPLVVIFIFIVALRAATISKIELDRPGTTSMSESPIVGLIYEICDTFFDLGTLWGILLGLGIYDICRSCQLFNPRGARWQWNPWFDTLARHVVFVVLPIFTPILMPLVPLLLRMGAAQLPKDWGLCLEEFRPVSLTVAMSVTLHVVTMLYDVIRAWAQARKWYLAPDMNSSALLRFVIFFLIQTKCFEELVIWGLGGREEMQRRSFGIQNFLAKPVKMARLQNPSSSS